MLLLMLVVGTGAAYLSSQLEFRGDFVELLPADTTEVKDLRFVEKKSGGSGFSMAQVLGGTQEQRRRFAAVFSRALERDKSLMLYADYRFDIAFFETRALWLLPTEKLSALTDDIETRVRFEKAKANPLFVDVLDEPPSDFETLRKKYTSDIPTNEYFESKDGSELYVFAKPRGLNSDLSFNRTIIAYQNAAAAEALTEFPGLRVNFTGAFVARIEEDEVMKGDLSRASIFSGLIACAIIVLATRKPSALVLVVTPIALGILLTFAGTRLAIGHLNPVTGFLAAILTGLGIEYGVHLSMRYWEERAHLPSLEAMQETIRGTFSGALTSALTNAAAFAVLGFAEFSAFRQFGSIAAAGVLLTVSMAYLAGPAVLFAFERLRPPAAPKPAATAGPTRQTAQGGFSSAWLLALVALVGAAGIASAVVLPRLSFQNDLRKLKGDSPATDLDTHIVSELGMVMSPALVYARSLEEAEHFAQAARQIAAEDGDTGAIQRTQVISDLVPKDVEQRQQQLDRLRRILEQLPNAVRNGDNAKLIAKFQAQVEQPPFGLIDLPPEITRRFATETPEGTFVLLFPRYTGFDASRLENWSSTLKRFTERAKTPNGAPQILDTNLIAAKVFRLIRQDGPKILTLAAAAVFVMIAISLRSLKKAVLVVVPLFLGVLCTFGAMYVFSIEFNFLNVVVLPNLLSIAVDNSVHVFHRYEEEGRGSLGHVFRTTGVAAIVATLTNAAGYGTLVTAHHYGLKSIAYVAMLGVACTFVGTTLVFPALLQLLERRVGSKQSVS